MRTTVLFTFALISFNVNGGFALVCKKRDEQTDLDGPPELCKPNEDICVKFEGFHVDTTKGKQTVYDVKLGTSMGCDVLGREGWPTTAIMDQCMPFKRDESMYTKVLFRLGYLCVCSTNMCEVGTEQARVQEAMRPGQAGVDAAAANAAAKSYLDAQRIARELFAQHYAANQAAQQGGAHAAAKAYQDVQQAAPDMAAQRAVADLAAQQATATLAAQDYNHQANIANATAKKEAAAARVASARSASSTDTENGGIRLLHSAWSSAIILAAWSFFLI